MSTMFDAEEYEGFVERVVEGDWEATRDTGPLYDIAIRNPNHDREILIDSARNRVSFRDASTDDWGIRQEKVPDITYSVSVLMGAGMQVPMNEMRYLGITQHQAESV